MTIVERKTTESEKNRRKKGMCVCVCGSDGSRNTYHIHLCEETMSIISMYSWSEKERERKRRKSIRCAGMLLRLVSPESHLSSSYSSDEYEIEFFSSLPFFLARISVISD